MAAVKLRWASRAVRSLNEARDYVALDNPEAARRMVHRLEAAVQQLVVFPMMGRQGMRAKTREWVVAGTPFILVYRVEQSHVTILALLHGSRDWLGPA
jgi:toxin ParE1/3/4